MIAGTPLPRRNEWFGRLILAGWFSMVTAIAGAAETNSLRLAIGPFFAPSDQPALQKPAALFPDLLMTRLSQQPDLQLVERDRVLEVYRELNLAANGMQSADAMLQVGQVLACDRFVTGLFVVGPTNTGIWVSIIEPRQGTLADLQWVPFDGDHPDLAMDAIAAFLGQMPAHRDPHKFIALGRFLDMSISSAHEDWTMPLRALVTRHFQDAGFGVVDNEAVSPVFEEFQLQQAGFREKAGHVKFQPSVWVVDARCKWVRTTETRLSVAIRLRGKAGEQIFQFQGMPGEALASNILATLESGLRDGGNVSADEAAGAEAKIYAPELTNTLRGRILLPPPRYTTNAEVSVFNRSGEIGHELFNQAQRVYLLDTNNLQAQLQIAGGYFGKAGDPASQERGVQLLDHLSQSTNAEISYHAYYLLAHGVSAWGPTGKTVVVKPVRAIDREREAVFFHASKERSMNSLEARLAANPDDLSARMFLALQYFEDMESLTNRLHGQRMLEQILVEGHPAYVTQASNILVNGIHTTGVSGDDILVMPAEQPRFPSARTDLPSGEIIEHPAVEKIDSFKDWPAVAEDHGWLIGDGTHLYLYSLEGGKTEIPCPATRRISAVAADHDYWWVGTEGDGLIRIPKSGNAPARFTEADGLLMPAISALRRVGDRLWIGFGFRGVGGIGYLDLKTWKFVGIQRNAGFSNAFTSEADLLSDVPIFSLAPADTNSFWALSYRLQQIDSASVKPLRTVSASFDLDANRTAVGARFVAMSSGSGDSLEDLKGVKIYDLAANRWRRIAVSPHDEENSATALCFDGGSLWAACVPHDNVQGTVLDLIDADPDHLKVVARFGFPAAGWIGWIGTGSGNVWFLARYGRDVKLFRFLPAYP